MADKESTGSDSGPTPRHDMLLLDAADIPQQAEATVAGGTVIGYTCRSPDKETDNEDCIAVIPYGPAAAVLVVADGVGGMPAGRRASRQAIETLDASLQKAMTQTMLLRSAIIDGIDAANHAVQELGNGSATTLTVVTIQRNIARTYQVGDSEAVIVGQRGLVRAQAVAHSPTGFAVEAGFLDERAALHHAERHLVSNLIGTSDMRIDIGAATELQPCDTILLASDGLTDNLHLHEIIELIRKGPLDRAMNAITNLASRRMTVDTKHQPSKPDDLSIILFRKSRRAGSTDSGT